MRLNSSFREDDPIRVSIPVLVYHQIEPVGTLGTEHRGIVVDANFFYKQMSWLHSFGYSSITFDDLILILEGKRAVPKRAFVLSFDDGYHGIYDHAFPVLREFGFGATIFCIAEDFDATRKETAPRAFRTLHRDQIQELLKAGFSLGSHSVSHCDLASVSAERALNEISGSRKILEDMFGARVSSFAYPYGRHTALLESIVEENGYVAGVTTAYGRNHEIKDRFRLKRLPIGFDQGLLGYVSRFFGFRYL